MAETHSKISDFVAYIKKNGVALNNRFDVLLTLPNGVTDLAFYRRNGKSEFGPDPRTLSLMALSVSMPGVNVSTTEMRLGVTRKIPYDRSTGELDMVFRCSADMIEKRVFDAWISAIFTDQHTLEYYEDYVTDITVSTVDNQNNTSYQCRYSEAYPAVITPLTFDRENQNTIATFQVTFNYRKVYNNEDDQFVSNAPVTSANAQFGAADPRIKPRPTLPFINAIPGLSEGQSQQVVDMWKQIARVRQEIQNGGLSATAGAQLIATITRGVRASLGEGMPGDAVNVALEYLNDAAFLLRK